MLATGTVTDALGVIVTDTLDVDAGGATGVRTIRSSFLGTRMNFGNVVTPDTQGPTPDPDPYGGMGPTTLGMTARAMRDARTTGVRIYKHPDGTGTIVAHLWSSTGTVLASSAPVTWVADEGGWATYEFTAPVELEEGLSYHWGYYYPTADQNYIWSAWAFNGQDTCVYPLHMLQFGTSGAGTNSGGTFRTAGATAPAMTGTYRTAHNYYVDPLVEWDLTSPGYSSGESYYDQFPNGGSSFDFPISVFFADPENLVGYRTRGINTLRAGGASDAYIAAVKASGIDWYPSISGGDTSVIVAMAEDPDLAARVKGYLLTDEPDLNTPWNAPSVLRGWRNAARRLDSTRPIHLNLSRYVAINQGFTWQPVGIGAEAANLEWREYLSLADSGSLDLYALSGTDSFGFSSATNRYGIWVYPLVIHRLREQITDERIPLWAIIETTSAYPDSPTPTQVKKAVWASLIAGAKGIEYFDHRFAGPAVSQDFAAMLNDSAMTSAITALNAQLQTLAPALWAAETGYITGYTTTGTLAVDQGGLPAGASIPLHYTSREVVGDGTTTYFFVQTMRAGSTSATLAVPGFEGATLTVIGESRAVTVDGTGHFTDSFTGDYVYHLYSTTHTPVFTAPANTVAPAVTGTAAEGQTLTVSSGTWTGVPAPTFTYQWQRNTVDISGATGATYTLTTDDVGQSIRCHVTATNSQGTASANSNAVVPTSSSTAPTINIFGTGDPAVTDTGLDYLNFFSSTPGWVCNRFDVPIGTVITGARLYVDSSATLSGLSAPNQLEFGLWENASVSPDNGAGRTLANFSATVDRTATFVGTVTPGTWHEVSFAPYTTTTSSVWIGHLWGINGEFGQLWTDNRSAVTVSPDNASIDLAHSGAAIAQFSSASGWTPGAFYAGLDLLAEDPS